MDINKLIAMASAKPSKGSNLEAVVRCLPTRVLRPLYAEAYEGEYSNDGDLGEDLALTADRDQLVEDLIFFLEAQV